MTYISRAQNFEDYRLFRALSNISQGFYIDIGAWDPEYHSVSHNFHESGWRGVNVEPLKEAYLKLKLKRKNDLNIQAFVTSSLESVEMFQIEKSGISSGHPQRIAQLKSNSYFSGKIEKVTPVTLSEVFDLLPHQDIHWMKIDVEGAELNVLDSWGDSKERPWIVLVEATSPGTEIRSDANLSKYFTDRQYEFVYFDGLNVFYVHKDHPEIKMELSKPISIFDDVIKYEDYLLRSAMDKILEKSSLVHESLDDGFLGQPEIELLAQEILFMREKIERFREFEDQTSQAISDLESEKHELSNTLSVLEGEKHELSNTLSVLEGEKQKLIEDRDDLHCSLQNLEFVIHNIQESRIFRFSLPLRKIYFSLTHLTFQNFLIKTLRFLVRHIVPRTRLRHFLQRNLPPVIQLQIKKLLQTDPSQLSTPIQNRNNWDKVWDPELDLFLRSVRSSGH